MYPSPHIAEKENKTSRKSDQEKKIAVKYMEVKVERSQIKAIVQFI